MKLQPPRKKSSGQAEEASLIALPSGILPLSSIPPLGGILRSGKKRNMAD
jgi:hypothetical protein